MKLLDNADGTLKFELESNDAAKDHQEFIEVMANYRMVKQGSRVLFYNIRSKKLDACMNIGDNSFFICQTDGFKIAVHFGTKRFIVGNARLSLKETEITQEKMVKFARDRSFPLKDAKEMATPFKIVSLQELLEINKTNLDLLYADLAELFNRCANFTPGKQKEYAGKGEKTDKLCRFNLENNAGTDDTHTVQVFLLDNNNKVVGTCSAIIIMNENAIADVYFYDEIVDYFTRLNQEEKALVITKAEELRQIEDQLTKEQENKSALEAKKEELKTMLAQIIEPKRAELMPFLFAAIRQNVRKAIRKLQPLVSDSELDRMIDDGRIRPFIRAAAERVGAYEQLGCGQENTNHFVIHGPRTRYAELVDLHIKQLAEQQLLSCQPVPQFSNAAAIASFRYDSSPIAVSSAMTEPTSSTTYVQKKP